MADDNMDSILNDNEQEKLWELIKSKKLPPTINKLFKYDIKERNNILQNMFNTAKDNINKLAEHDIKYKDSYLHNRFNEAIFYDNNYYSIQTGKYTSAPYNTYLFEKIISLM